MKTDLKISNEYMEMFQALEEGIIVVKNGSLNFQNGIFKQIIEWVGVGARAKN